MKWKNMQATSIPAPRHTLHAKYYKQIVFAFPLAREKKEEKNERNIHLDFRSWRLSIMRYVELSEIKTEYQ